VKKPEGHNGGSSRGRAWIGAGKLGQAAFWGAGAGLGWPGRGFRWPDKESAKDGNL